MIILDKTLVDIEVLKFTGFYKYFNDLIISETDNTYIVDCPLDIEGYLNEAYEEHTSYELDFPSELLQEVVNNAGDIMTKSIDLYLDSIAKEYRYDNMASVRSYTGFENPFQEEALRLSKWCADCWVKAGEIEQDVLNGNRAMPTLEEVISEFPSLDNY